MGSFDNDAKKRYKRGYEAYRLSGSPTPSLEGLFSSIKSTPLKLCKTECLSSSTKFIRYTSSHTRHKLDLCSNTWATTGRSWLVSSYKNKKHKSIFNKQNTIMTVASLTTPIHRQVVFWKHQHDDKPSCERRWVNRWKITSLPINLGSWSGLGIH